ncbi:ATP-binding protein [Lyngbya aestuarii]|uniref:ATP-binding protein n=1 Tax=Lyngbya aestuarii TaxID=118322 RepID=UPI00403D8E6E
MGRILLLIDHIENCRLLAKLLADSYQVLRPDAESGFGAQAPGLLAESFDLGIVNGSGLSQLREQIKARRESQQPVFLPFILITSRPEVGMATDSLEYVIDELIKLPVEKEELKTRLRVLLRSREMSLKLKATNEQLQHEIVERIQTEAALRYSDWRFRQLAENINQVFWLTSSDKTQMLYVSPAYEAIWGRTSQSLQEQPLSWLDTVHSEDQQLVRDSLEIEMQGKFSSQEFRIVHPEKGIRWLESRAFPIKSDSGKLERIAGIVEDITERKQADLDTRQALEREKELNELKSRFVAMVSHEFRNPLNAISGLTQLLERYSSSWSAEKKQEVFGRIRAGVNKMDNLLDDVLLIGRAEVGKLKFEPVQLELEKLCRELINELQLSTESKHQIEFTYQGSKTAVVDEKLLRQILTNLLSNALKYSPKGSTVECQVNCQASQVTFQIQDQGIGIPEKDKPRLFESFHRAANVGKIPGTGLGLAIVKQCVELHQGEITVESEVGVGTTFRVTLSWGEQR